MSGGSKCNALCANSIRENKGRSLAHPTLEAPLFQTYCVPCTNLRGCDAGVVQQRSSVLAGYRGTLRLPTSVAMALSLGVCDVLAFSRLEL